VSAVFAIFGSREVLFDVALAQIWELGDDVGLFFFMWMDVRGVFLEGCRWEHGDFLLQGC